MVALVENDSLDWPSVVQLFEELSAHGVVCVGVAQNEVFDQVWLVVLIVNADVHF